MITTESLIITMDDCRKAGHCTMGVRRWMNYHGFPFRDFMANGIPAAAMLATGDAQGAGVVASTVRRRLLAGSAVSDPEALQALERGIDG